MAFDFDDTLATVRSRQWSLADIDWDAPGAETMSDEQRRRLRPFMADLVWIEHLGARGFAALADKAPTPTIRQIYLYFQAEEQKHANAELALMKRWGMLAHDDAIPEPNINVRMAIEGLDRFADAVNLAGLSATIALLECALDGALVKFLLDEVEDPLCHEVFRRINADESRHLAVDFQVLELVGAAPLVRQVEMLVKSLRPNAILQYIAVFVPLINKMRDNVIAMGLSERQLYRAVERFVKNGARGQHTRRIPMFHVLRRQARMITNRAHPYHRLVADPMVRLTARIPARVFGDPPSWTEELTHRPVAQ